MDDYGSDSESHVIEGDLGTGTTQVVWFYFILLGIALYLLIAGLTVLFRIELAGEEKIKIEEIESREKIELRQEEAKVLSGEKGLLEGKKPVSIDEAMAQIVRFLNESN